MADQAGLNVIWLKIPEDTFSRDVAQMILEMNYNEITHAQGINKKSRILLSLHVRSNYGRLQLDESTIYQNVKKMKVWFLRLLK